MDNILPEQPTAPTPSATAEGVTAIEDSVIGTVAALAAREIPGVHALGSASARAVGSIRDALGSSDSDQGVAVALVDRNVTVDIVLVAAYPVPLPALAESVRAAVTQAIEGLVGLSVTAVNVTITDIYADEEADDNGVVTSSPG